MLTLYLIISSFIAGRLWDSEENLKYNLFVIISSLLFPFYILWAIIQSDYVNFLLVLIGLKKIVDKERYSRGIDYFWDSRGRVWRYLAEIVKKKLKKSRYSH